MAERDLAAALASGMARTSGPHRNVLAARAHARLGRRTLAEINRHLRALERILSREARRREPPADAAEYCSLTIALLPLRGRGRRTPGADRTRRRRRTENA